MTIKDERRSEYRTCFDKLEPGDMFSCNLPGHKDEVCLKLWDQYSDTGKLISNAATISGVVFLVSLRDDVILLETTMIVNNALKKL